MGHNAQISHNFAVSHALFANMTLDSKAELLIGLVEALERAESIVASQPVKALEVVQEVSNIFHAGMMFWGTLRGAESVIAIRIDDLCRSVGTAAINHPTL